MGLEAVQNKIGGLVDATIFHLAGNFDETSAINFLKLAKKFMSENEYRIFVLDMSGITSFNNAAAGALAKLQQQLVARNGILVLTQPTTPIVETLKTLNVMDSFTIQEKLSKGVEAARFFAAERDELLQKQKEEIVSTREATRRLRSDEGTSSQKLRHPTEPTIPMSKISPDELVQDQEDESPRKETAISRSADATRFVRPQTSLLGNKRKDSRVFTKEERTSIVEKTKVRKKDDPLKKYIYSEDHRTFQAPAEIPLKKKKYTPKVLLALPTKGGQFKQMGIIVGDLAHDLFIALEYLLPFKPKEQKGLARTDPWEDLIQKMTQAELIIVDFSPVEATLGSDPDVLSIAVIARLVRTKAELVILNSSMKNVPSMWKDFPMKMYNPSTEAINKLKPYFEELMAVIPPSLPEEDG